MNGEISKRSERGQGLVEFMLVAMLVVGALACVMRLWRSFDIATGKQEQAWSATEKSWLETDLGVGTGSNFEEGAERIFDAALTEDADFSCFNSWEGTRCRADAKHVIGIWKDARRAANLRFAAACALETCLSKGGCAPNAVVLAAKAAHVLASFATKGAISSCPRTTSILEKLRKTLHASWRIDKAWDAFALLPEGFPDWQSGSPPGPYFPRL